MNYKVLLLFLGVVLLTLTLLLIFTKSNKKEKENFPVVIDFIDFKITGAEIHNKTCIHFGIWNTGEVDINTSKIKAYLRIYDLKSMKRIKKLKLSVRCGKNIIPSSYLYYKAVASCYACNNNENFENIKYAILDVIYLGKIESYAITK